MAWTYDLSTDVGRLRLEIGATDSAATVTLTDEEIQQALDQEATYWGQAARAAEMLALKWAQKVDVRLGRSMQLTYSKMAEQYAQLAKGLRKKAISANAPWVGGMSTADKQAYQEDSSLVQPLFAREMQESSNAGSLTADTPAAADDQTV